MNDSSRQLDLSSLAIDQLVGIGDLLFQGCGVGHEFESRAGLVDIAHRVVLEQTRGGVTEVVGIKGGANGQGKYLPGLRILNHHGAIQCMRAGERGIKSAFGHELNIFVDAEHQILPWVRFAFLASQYVAASIERGQHASGNTMQIAVVFALDSSQTVVIGAYISQDLSGELAVGVVAFEFFLEVNALEIESLYARDYHRIKLARDPGKVS